MKKALNADKLQIISRTHYALHDINREARGHAEHSHLNLQARCITSGHLQDEKSDDDSSSSDSVTKYSQEDDDCSSNLGKLFPPPNPLPPKALMYLKEPLRMGANIHLM